MRSIADVMGMSIGARYGISVLSLAAAASLSAQVNVFVSPAPGATGVATSQQVVFTFDSPMDAEQTTVAFYKPPLTAIPCSVAWTFGYTRLTCTPSPSWPGSSMVVYSLEGVDILGDSASASGYFMTAAGSGGTGSGTNAVTTFGLQSVHFYTQTGSAAPTPDPEDTFLFYSFVSLASNRTANVITLTPPGATEFDLTQNQFYPEDYSFGDWSSNLTAFNTTYPQGTYAFNVYATASNQTANVTLSAPSQQPNPPHVSNHTAAQSINPNLDFTLQWHPFTNGTTADFISVYTSDDTFSTPDPEQPGALNGTARSVTIPAGTLQPDTTYDAYLTFYRATFTTNAGSATSSLRATQTAITLITTSGSTPAGPIWLTNNIVVANSSFQCQIQSSPGQDLTVLVSTNLSAGSWTPLLITNSTSGTLTFTDTITPAASRRFYRVQAP